MSNLAQEPVIEFVRPGQLWKEMNISAASGWRRVADGTLPKPVPVGPNSVAFIRSEAERAKANIINRARKATA